MNIDEWISHYFQVGADRVVLIDNGSSDGTIEKAQAWVDKGRVDLISRPQKHRQIDHYWDAFQRFIRTKYEWLLVADLDEFWFCPDGNSIPKKLSEPQFLELDVVYVHWTMFGSSGLTQHPNSIRSKLVHRSPGLSSHLNSKYICRTSILKSPRSVGIHKAIGGDSSRTATDNDSFRLFHYPIQSLEYFTTVKMTRGDATSENFDTIRDLTYFEKYDAPCTIEDRTLADLLEQHCLGK